MNGEKTSRKRRGNLPKETTDQLRSWFVSHLSHPYPTEDEKQDLMRQTGLQMSKFTIFTYPIFLRVPCLTLPFLDQISNWFINARRRQLPAMINSARAEVDAMTSRGPEGKYSGSADADRFKQAKKDRNGVPLSDGESTGHEDDYDLAARRANGGLNRGSV